MPRACCILRISGDCQPPVLLPFPSIELLCRSRKEHIAATIKRRFDGVLDDTEDETYSEWLDTRLSHANITRNAHVYARSLFFMRNNLQI